MSTLSYENELWNGINIVYERFEEGGRTVGDMVKFLTDRKTIEEKYAKSIQNLFASKSHWTEKGTLGNSWSQIRQQHENIQKITLDLSASLLKDLIRPLDALKKEQGNQKAKLANDVDTLDKEMKRRAEILRKRKADYYRASENAENALINYEKAQQDPNFPPKNLTKLNSNQQKFRAEAEKADQEYKEGVAEFQIFQKKFEESMKQILSEFQVMEETRIDYVKDIVMKYLSTHEVFVNSLQKETAALKKAIEAIDRKADIQAFIGMVKTGESPEAPVEYEPYESKFEHPKAAVVAQPPGGPGAPKAGGVPGKKISLFNKKKRKDGTDGPPAPASLPPPAALPPVGGAQSGGNSGQPGQRSVFPSQPPPQPRRAKAVFEYVAGDETEIGFRVDDIITVHTIDESGWWTGEINGKEGMFPGNYVELIKDAPVVTAPAQSSPSTATPSPVSAAPVAAAQAAATPTPTKKCLVQFDYTASSADELTISVGEVVTILSETEGWFIGRNDRDEEGMFPANYVQVNN